MRIKKMYFFMIFAILSIQLVSLMQNISDGRCDSITPEINDVQFWSQNGDLSGSNLQISLGSTVLNVHRGARNLDSFSPMGHTTEGTYTKMKARAYFSVSFNIYSAILPDNIYVGSQQVERKVKYAGVLLCTSPSTQSTYKPQTDYYQTYTDWDLSKAALTTEARGYSGRIPVTCSISDLTPTKLDFGNVQFNVNTKSFVATPTKISIKSASTYEIAKYTDYWNDAMGFSETNLNVVNMIKNPDTLNGGGIDTTSLNSLGLSVISTNQPSQWQGMRDTPEVNLDDILENGLPITLRPNIRLHTQTLKLTSQDKIVIDYQRDFWDTTSGILPAPQWSSPQRTTTLTRTVGWHVNNYCISVVLNVECDVYSLIEIVPKTSTSSMGTVNISVENKTWSNSVGGTGASYTVSDSVISSLLKSYGPWIIAIGIAIGVIVILVYTPVGSVVLHAFGKKPRR